VATSLKTVCRALLWNCCAAQNTARRASPIAVLSLGDNYDLRKLFTPESGQKLDAYTAALAKKDISLSYSTPDLIVLDLARLPQKARLHFKEPISDLSLASQDRMDSSRKIVEGSVTPGDVILACGLKTSIRSDRMFQFLFEANAWKFIWRRVFSLPACPYYSITSQTFGADQDAFAQSTSAAWVAPIPPHGRLILSPRFQARLTSSSGSRRHSVLHLAPVPLGPSLALRRFPHISSLDWPSGFGDHLVPITSQRIGEGGLPVASR